MRLGTMRPGAMRPGIIAMAAALTLVSAPLAASAQPRARPAPALQRSHPWAHLPHQSVTSHIGMMNELQKRGPNAYVVGPYVGGQYIVVGPLAGPHEPRHERRVRIKRKRLR